MECQDIVETKQNDISFKKFLDTKDRGGVVA